MKISQTTWTILIVSLVVALLIMVGAFVVMRIRINKVKKRYQEEESKYLETSRAVTEREEHGQLLWELKSKSEKPLHDLQMEFLINTALRNSYKTVNVTGSMSDYEIKSMVKLAKTKQESLKPDLAIIFPNDNLDTNFDKEYKVLQQGKMIAIVNASRKKKQIKKTISYLKTIKAKYEWKNIGEGIVLVVK